ncbi:MAG TPA: PIG-L family deacetylase [Aromatoleum sp.]|uniref:PIG-L family deacetylase n=1 Tax=Aromatoleum sp. TaxID=2307007 RepID=UPI002B46E15E|nr:PIG-L family deacetylase [Aromatoleum sp.]HJV24428.1 PIG-L family deacetylase [Aromatoleum sp.]
MSGCAGVRPYNVRLDERLSAFIVAHPDDWQLFMGDVAVDEASRHRPVLFVYLTTGGADRSVEYWHSREAGGLASAYAAANFDSAASSEAPPSDCGQVAIQKHMVMRCNYANTVSYFLRLPDGAVEGTGFAVTQMQSLKKLQDGEIGVIDAVDGSATYQGWEDLSQTVGSLLIREKQLSGAESVQMHAPEPDADANPGDHSDHRAVGALVQRVAAQYKFPASYYIGYAISQRRPNLSIKQASAKMLVFMTYDQQRLNANRRWSAYAEEPANYSSWLFRTYRHPEAEAAH